MFMKYETFKEKLSEEVLRLLLKDSPDGVYQVKMDTICHTNKKLDQLIIISNEKSFAPAIKVEQLYDIHMSIAEINEVAGMIVEQYHGSSEMCIEMTQMVSDNLTIDNLFLEVINTKWNQEYLKGLPHRDFLNLSIIYRVCIACDNNGRSSVVVTHGLMKRLGITSEEELYEKALANTKRLFPFKAEDLGEVRASLLLDDEKESCTPEDMVDRKLESGMIELSNSTRINGSSVLLYPEFLQRAAEMLGCELCIILPSSINEVLVMAMPLSTDGLEDIIREINLTMVAEEERLSDQFYIFDCKSNSLSIAVVEDNALIHNEEDFELAVVNA